MFQDLEHRASRALSNLCDVSVASPLAADDAGYLGFFTRVVERLEGGAARARQLVEEKSRHLLAHAVSRIFSHLLRSDPHFDFGALTAPVPEVIEGALADWVDDHVDELMAELAPANDDDLLTIEEGGADDADDGDDAVDDVSP
jgi:hypothetical protein